MADNKRAEDEDAASTLVGTEVVRIVQGGNSKQTTAAAIAALYIPVAPAAPAEDNETATAYTLALSDAPAASAYQGIVVANNASAIVITVPLNAAVAFNVPTLIQIIQKGAGQVSVVGDSGVTVHNAASNTTRVQWSTLLLTKIATNEWVLSGDNT